MESFNKDDVELMTDQERQQGKKFDQKAIDRKVEGLIAAIDTYKKVTEEKLFQIYKNRFKTTDTVPNWLALLKKETADIPQDQIVQQEIKRLAILDELKSFLQRSAHNVQTLKTINGLIKEFQIADNGVTFNRHALLEFVGAFADSSSMQYKDRFYFELELYKNIRSEELNEAIKAKQDNRLGAQESHNLSTSLGNFLDKIATKGKEVITDVKKTIEKIKFTGEEKNKAVEKMQRALNNRTADFKSIDLRALRDGDVGKIVKKYEQRQALPAEFIAAETANKPKSEVDAFMSKRKPG